jgi:single-stranded-DNA-specific exonuclease
MTSPVKTWALLPHDRDAAARLASRLGVSPLVAQLLLNRGLAEPEPARRFLDAPLSGLHPPHLLPGVATAAERLLAAVGAGRKICIYGDYDVDGTTGTAILLQLLRILRAEHDWYVPHRLEEGYGLHVEALRKIAASGSSVVVTVDCGIGSVAEAVEARRLGMELIVTDHHEPRGRLPTADVLVHPRLPGTEYPFGMLSGSAVAFKLAWEVAKRASGGDKVKPEFREFLLDAVALASLGVVADVVPLHDENRILVKHGLNRLGKQPPLGLSALCESAGLVKGAEVRASDIAFKLGPRLNAAGRLGCARLVVELLTTTRREQAVDLARFLEDTNAKRQTLERRLVQEARDQAEAKGYATMPAVVLAGAGWHGGVLGIVAGKLAELYGRPALMISLPTEGDGPGVGSGRAPGGFPLHRALEACGQLLLSHGGHAAAAGFRVRPGEIDAFRERFCEYTTQHFPDGPPPPTLELDVEAPLSALTLGLLDDLDRLEPYGADNPAPVFLAGGLEVVGEPRKVGAGATTLSFKVRQNGTLMKAVGFGMADRAEELMSAGGACCLAFVPKRNEWQGRVSVDLVVKDLQAGAEARLG